jgi:hypothetical protein
VRKYYGLLFILIALTLISCGKNEVKQNTQQGSNNSFGWKENISAKDIPDFPLKGMIDGQEIKLEYINFEFWRGSNDNVFNFSDKTPKNKCGFIENDNAFHLTKLGGEFKKGEFIKETFSVNIEGCTGDFHTTVNENMQKFTPAWNCALVITDKNDDIVTGKIAMCFKDEKKSWMAGTFTAVRCNN